MDFALNSLIKLYISSSGRRLFALRKVRVAAASMGLTDMVTRVDEAMAHDQVTRELDTRWNSYGNHRPLNIKEIDALVDNALSGLRDGATAQARGARTGDPIIGKANDFLHEILPGGVGAVTSLPYVEELAAVDVIVAKLQGPLAPVVAELGLTRQAERLAALAGEYRAALEQGASGVVSFPQVRAARNRGQEYLLEVVAMILGSFPNSHDPAHVAARATLLGPILEQNEAIREYQRARRVLRDVDPETGTPDPEPTELATDQPEASGSAPGPRTTRGRA